MITTLFYNFILSSLGASALILIILFLKKGLQKHISSRWQYNIDIFFLVLLAIPLLPNRMVAVFNLNSLFFRGDSISQTISESIKTHNNTAQTITRSDWMQDFSVSVTRFIPEEYFAAFAVLWVVGGLFFAAAMFFGGRRLKMVIESVKPVEDTFFCEMFHQAKLQLNVKTNVLFGRSIMVNSPITVGVFRPLIVLPFNVFDTFSEQEINHILLHELAHCKRRDLVINSLLCFFQLLYWFNPLVYFTFQRIKLDREIACDLYVLNCLPEKNYVCYGKTLINFVEKTSRFHALSFSMEMGGAKNQLTQRIKKIAAYKSETVLQHTKGIGMFIIIGLLVFFQVPFISALAAKKDDRYYFNEPSVQYEDLSWHFNGYQGSFVGYDLANEQYTIHNKIGSETRVSPLSTYKIYSALIGLETNILSPRSVLQWNGSTYPYESWNQDHNLETAMQNSVNWYFQEIDAQVGIHELNAYFTRLSYGNYDLSKGISDYWNESSLLISPIEQLILLKDFYLNETIFMSEHVESVKDVLRLSEKNGVVLSGKTGTGAVNGKLVNGWFIGYVENGGETYIFATNIKGKDNAGGNVAVQITLSILKDMGIF